MSKLSSKSDRNSRTTKQLKNFISRLFLLLRLNIISTVFNSSEYFSPCLYPFVCASSCVCRKSLSFYGASLACKTNSRHWSCQHPHWSHRKIFQTTSGTSSGETHWHHIGMARGTRSCVCVCEVSSHCWTCCSRCCWYCESVSHLRRSCSWSNQNGLCASSSVCGKTSVDDSKKLYCWYENPNRTNRSHPCLTYLHVWKFSLITT